MLVTKLDHHARGILAKSLSGVSTSQRINATRTRSYAKNELQDGVHLCASGGSAGSIEAPCLVAAGLSLVAAPAWAESVQNASSVPPVDNGWLSPIVDSLNFILGNVEGFYVQFGVPYSYGWSIVTLTAIVKLLTLPLIKKQVESAMAVQALKPRVDVIKERYGDDKKKVQKETSRLYEQAEVNPLAGCFPSLLQLPIYIGLFRSFSNFAGSGTLDNEGFYWLPSLSGPISSSDRLAGLGTAWLFPFVDGHPPIGWDAAAPYLVLPVLLVLAQYASSAVLSPVDPNGENALVQRVLIGVLPLTIGYFSLTVPSGLSLYYFSNSIFTIAQQVYFRKLGGATVDTPDLGPVTKLGMGRKTGRPVHVPRAAADLPEVGCSDALASEFGAAPAPKPAPAATNDDAAAPTVGTDSAKNQHDTQIMGGLVVLMEDMQGVDEGELQYLQRRCKRRRRPAMSI